MRYALAVLVLIAAPAALPAATPKAGPAVELADFNELLKLPRDQLPAITFARPIIRLSPAGDRFLYIRMYGNKAKLHLRRVGSAGSDEPVVWDEPIPDLFCRRSFAGLPWRADGQRVLFAQEPAKDEPGWAPGTHGRHMSPWHMCYDLPNPQCKRCRHMTVEGTTGCTGLTYSPDGKLLWTAFGEPHKSSRAGLTCWDAAAGKGRCVYRRGNAGIYHLVPSPDGKHLAWVETHPRKGPGTRPSTDVVVFDIQAGKAVRRIDLAPFAGNWVATPPPVWTVDSAAVCYGDVVQIDRIYRREVRLMPLAAGAAATARLLARDAIAVGAIADGIICNRGPGCQPMAQMLSSWAPPGGTPHLPASNDVILCGLAGGDSPATLRPGAFAQQVLPGSLLYAHVSGGDVLVVRARLQRRGGPAKPPPPAKPSARP